ncbi:olfactory receptor 10J4-like [Cebidichthys violaceus]|uniref:olfactory receptor 10J4-like n=1 Tax=Cebidichthys violaceus TaxID=271503 RepID=UPI0035CB9D03
MIVEGLNIDGLSSLFTKTVLYDNHIAADATPNHLSISHNNLPLVRTEDSYLPLSTNHRSSSVNGTWGPDGVTFFIIQGLASLGQEKMILFVILLLGYMIILGGNSMIIFVALTDSKLNSPMFFFLYNLSFVDIIYTTTTIPNLLSGLLAGMKTISVPGCFLQMYVFIQLAVTGRAILTVMAYDRYVAICNPLRYNAIMTLPVRLLLIAGAWSFGALCTLPASSLAFQRSYCGPNVVKHGWCDPSSVRRLVCGDVTVDNIVSLSFAMVALLTTGVLILTSYVLIGVSVSKMGIAQRLKAFGTCAAHLTVVSISYSSASCVYISYRVGNFPPEVRIIVSVLYAALTPFLNPMIYSLKNKELRESIMRTLSRFRPAAVLPTKDINTVNTVS